MKQHITVEQLYDLSKEDRNKFMAISGYIYLINEDDYVEKITIGRMIEMVEKNSKDLIISATWYTDEIEGFTVKCDKNSYTEIELCDALWESVKGVVERLERKNRKV